MVNFELKTWNKVLQMQKFHFLVTMLYKRQSFTLLKFMSSNRRWHFLDQGITSKNQKVGKIHHRYWTNTRKSRTASFSQPGSTSIWNSSAEYWPSENSSGGSNYQNRPPWTLGRIGQQRRKQWPTSSGTTNNLTSSTWHAGKWWVVCKIFWTLSTTTCVQSNRPAKLIAITQNVVLVTMWTEIWRKCTQYYCF